MSDWELASAHMQLEIYMGMRLLRIKEVLFAVAQYRWQSGCIFVIVWLGTHWVLCPFCRILFAGQYKVYISVWLHWKTIWPLPAWKLTILPTFLLCHLWVFKNEWYPGSLYLWRKPCSSREDLVCAGVPQGCLDSNCNHL